MRYLILALILTLPLGCKSMGSGDSAGDSPSSALFRSIRLDAKWAPLERLTERPDMLGSANLATTIGHTVYIEDIDVWLGERPIDGPRFNAIMSHERIHATRQLATGVTSWIARYATSTAFMWEEESIGWYLQIREWMRSGVRFHPEGVARTLHGYRNLAGRMVTYDEALAWVEAVLRGQWKPQD